MNPNGTEIDYSIQPVKAVERVNPEQAKYAEMWKHDAYRENAPGAQAAMEFMNLALPPPDADCIDFGAGTGRGAWLLAAVGKMRVTMLDFVPGCLDAEVASYVLTQPDRLNFHVQDLTNPIPYHAAYGFCTDVLEHIPTADVDAVLRNILSSAENVYLQISTVPDHFGPAVLGEPLHLTVKPLEWWLARLGEIGAMVKWSAAGPADCRIYCSAWRSTADIVKIGHCNTPDEVVDANVKTNVFNGWLHIEPHIDQDREVVMLCGGPSLNDHVDQIRELRAAGAALVTVNGTYNWAIEHDLEPSVQIVLDAREFNKRFTKPVMPHTKYLIASQCHPLVLQGLPWERTWLWHSGLSEASIKCVVDKTGKYFPIPGGSTVVLRAIPMLRMLGLSRIHMFGFDSCVSNDVHHAYQQDENDGEPLMPVTLAGRTFMCLPWMVSQATEFVDMIKFMDNHVELAVYGDGLIAHIIKTGANLQTTED